MNLSEYLAFGGLERMLLIGAAILISYWGYHLYGKAQIAGLSMIAVAALLLMSLVLTSGQHQQSVSASLLASGTATLPPPALTPEAVVAEVAEPLSAPVVADEPAAASTAPDPITEPIAGPVATDATPDSEGSITADTDPEQVAQAEAGAGETPPTIERLVPLASGSELGGRIVSVRSENVTLEWSGEDGRRRIISDSSKQ